MGVRDRARRIRLGGLNVEEPVEQPDEEITTGRSWGFPRQQVKLAELIDLEPCVAGRVHGMSIAWSSSVAEKVEALTEDERRELFEVLASRVVREIVDSCAEVAKAKAAYRAERRRRLLG